jgi:uncharacterized protein
MFARHFIDSLDFALKSQELRGDAPVSEMPRLLDLLAVPDGQAAPDGQVSYVLRGLTGKDGKPLLELALEGSCQLRCQRCLQGMPYAIKTVSLLMPVPENELEGLSMEGGELEEEDEIDRIPVNPHLDVLGLIEDEILLGLPLSPRHELGVCEAVAGSVSAKVKDQKQSPFAVLRGLKNK